MANPRNIDDSESVSLDLRAGVELAGRYRLERPLTRGGMGTLWVATHLSLDTPVVVKFLRVAADAPPEVLKRFQREAREAARLSSSHIVKILDHGIDGHVPYIVMELLRGEDLAGRVRFGKRLTLAATVEIINQAMRGLQVVHHGGLIHRDLKPQNIFLAREGEQEVVKLLDFGVAKIDPAMVSEASTSTRAGMLLGTPYYMSPEQARGRTDVDLRADLWSMGVVIYRMLTGKRPFDEAPLGDVIVQICSDPITPPTEVAPDLPPAIDAFMAKALARDRTQRFQSAKDLALALSAIAEASAADAAAVTAAPVAAAAHVPHVATPVPAAPAMPAAAPSEPTPAPRSAFGAVETTDVITREYLDELKAESQCGAAAAEGSSAAQAPGASQARVAPATEPLAVTPPPPAAPAPLPEAHAVPGGANLGTDSLQTPWPSVDTLAGARPAQQRTRQLTLATVAITAVVAVGGVAFMASTDDGSVASERPAGPAATVVVAPPQQSPFDAESRAAGSSAGSLDDELPEAQPSASATSSASPPKADVAPIRRNIGGATKKKKKKKRDLGY